jgi:glycosyltransferase involved in cell wall biosynthesis
LIPPKLSICIATYNRSKYISQTLDSIILNYNNQVEIVIVDGASTDNTEEVVLNYVNNYPNIFYYKLESKGGVDLDYDIAVEKSKGEMCWLFTDDDIMKDGIIEKVFQYFDNDTNLIVVNAEVKDKDLENILTKSQLKIKNDLVKYDIDINELFVITAQYLSFIGGVIINRQLWLSRNRKMYFGTEFIHLGVIFQEKIPGKSVIISYPYITIRFGNAQWTERSFKIWMFSWPEFIWSFSLITENSKKEVVARYPWMSLKKLFIHRLNGDYNYIVYKKYFSKKENNIFWNFFAFSISIIPRFVILKLHKIHFGFKIISNE